MPAWVRTGMSGPQPLRGQACKAMSKAALGSKGGLPGAASLQEPPPAPGLQAKRQALQTVQDEPVTVLMAQPVESGAGR